MTLLPSALLLALVAAAPAFAAETVALSTADCRRLVAHAPRADATYQGGVDVRGKAVVPADVGGAGAIDLPATIEIPVTIDVARRLGAGAPDEGLASRRGVEGKAVLGTLTIKGNEAFWNGAPLRGRDEAFLAEACASSLKARGIDLPGDNPGAPGKE